MILISFLALNLSTLISSSTLKILHTRTFKVKVREQYYFFFLKLAQLLWHDHVCMRVLIVEFNYVRKTTKFIGNFCL